MEPVSLLIGKVWLAADTEEAVQRGSQRHQQLRPRHFISRSAPPQWATTRSQTHLAYMIVLIAALGIATVVDTSLHGGTRSRGSPP